LEQYEWFTIAGILLAGLGVSQLIGIPLGLYALAVTHPLALFPVPVPSVTLCIQQLLIAALILLAVSTILLTLGQLSKKKT